MTRVKHYLSLIKFSHTIFALPFALIGFTLGIIDLGFVRSAKFNQVFLNNDFWSMIGLKLLLVLLCMVFARSAAMAFNRWLDQHIDAKNPRTIQREIPAGIISSKNALTFTIISSLLFIATTFFINQICFFLSPIALFVILFYSYTKRFTPLCHLVLGLGLSLAPIGAYLALTGKFDIIPLIFSFIVLTWVSGFDIIYALQDEEFDRENDLKSIPAALGKQRALGVSTLLHCVSAFLVIFAGIKMEVGILYWIGALVFVGMLLYQHSIVKPNDLSRVNLAFMTANGIASVVFAVFTIVSLITGW